MFTLESQRRQDPAKNWTLASLKGDERVLFPPFSTYLPQTGKRNRCESGKKWCIDVYYWCKDVPIIHGEGRLVWGGHCWGGHTRDRRSVSIRGISWFLLSHPGRDLWPPQQKRSVPYRRGIPPWWYFWILHHFFQRSHLKIVGEHLEVGYGIGENGKGLGQGSATSRTSDNSFRM